MISANLIRVFTTLFAWERFARFAAADKPRGGSWCGLLADSMRRDLQEWKSRRDGNAVQDVVRSSTASAEVHAKSPKDYWKIPFGCGCKVWASHLAELRRVLALHRLFVAPVLGKDRECVVVSATKPNKHWRCCHFSGWGPSPVNHPAWRKEAYFCRRRVCTWYYGWPSFWCRKVRWYWVTLEVAIEVIRNNNTGWWVAKM